MSPASVPRKARRDGQLLSIADGAVAHRSRAHLPSLLSRGDLLVLNDAATIPAGFYATHLRSGVRVEVRLAERRSLDPHDLGVVTAIVLGDGDHRTRTEHRAEPPELRVGDAIVADGLHATVLDAKGRWSKLALAGVDPLTWLLAHGHPIQYAHVEAPIALWDAQTVLAGPPVSFEAPSAAFVLDWEMLRAISDRGVVIATLTHAAGLSSTGDAELDASLPWAEPYAIPRRTAMLVAQQRERGGRVVAVGTTVVRALEDAFEKRVLGGIARSRIDAAHRPRVVDAILSGMHAPGESHFELLRAFESDEALHRAHHIATERGYLSHEYGDSTFVVARAG